MMAVGMAVVAAMIMAGPVLAQSVDPTSGDGEGFAAFYGTPAPNTATAPASPLFTPNFVAPAIPATDRTRAVDCMSWAIAYESARQPIAGQEAVGQVILNRVRDPRRPKTVCGVVFEGSERRTGCQFTFACDGSLHRRLSADTMLVARSVASAVLDGAAPDHVGGATHYHADYVLPIWAATGRRVAKIGAHIFYEMPGDAGRALAPVITAGEPEMAMESVLDRPAPRRAGRRARQPAIAARSVTPAASHAMFQPWGLPAASQP
jgi:hypothetical protein